MKRNMRKRKFILIPLFIIVGVLVFGGLVMFLWNMVLAQVLHLSTISFFQAVGILILSKILFSGFRGGWGRHHDHRQKWQQHLAERWARMTPEEREKFKQKIKSRCRPGWDFPGNPFAEEEKQAGDPPEAEKP